MSNGPVDSGQGENETFELVRRFLTGEQEIFHDLIRPFESMYYRHAICILRNSHDAEDAVQQALVVIFTRLAQLKVVEHFKPWSMRIVQNEAKLIWRKRRRNFYHSIHENCDDGSSSISKIRRNFADWRDLPSELLEKREFITAVEMAIRQLPENYGEILFLRDVQQLNVTETMEILGLSESAVKTRLHRARLMLREILAPAFSKPRPSVLERMKGLNPWLAAKR